MVRNSIRRYRKNAKLTQAQLAELVGTSQQQIHRIESGAQAVRLDLAMQICAVLGAKMEEVFPSAAKSFAGAVKRVGLDKDDPPISLYRDERAAEELEAAGLDVELDEWTFRVELRNGFTDALSVSGPD